LCTRFQPGQFRIRDHGLQAQQRLILLDELSFLDQNRCLTTPPRDVAPAEPGIPG
jgi:hypothetical protein